jgi:hypothetical protein
MDRHSDAIAELRRRRVHTFDDETDQCRLLVSLGHPLAEPYSESLEFYNALRWPSPNGRVVTLRDLENLVELTRPRLLVAPAPQGVSSEAWIRRLARKRFPPDASAGADFGRWTFTTNDRRSIEKLRAALGVRGIEWRAIDNRFVRQCFDIHHFRNLRDAVGESLSEWSASPPRQRADPGPSKRGAARTPASGAQAATAPCPSQANVQRDLFV